MAVIRVHKLLGICLCASALAGAQIDPGFSSDRVPVLVFSGVGGFAHASRTEGIGFFRRWDSASVDGSGIGIKAEFSEAATVFTKENLARFKAIVLISCTEIGKIVNADQKKALLDFVRGGGGLVAIHGSLDSKGSWPEYTAMAGAELRIHWVPDTRRLVPGRSDRARRLLAGVPAAWDGHEEWYSTEANARDLDTIQYVRNPAPTPGFPDSLLVSWAHPYGSGIVVATVLGHDAQTYATCGFGRLLRNGVLYASRMDMPLGDPLPGTSTNSGAETGCDAAPTGLAGRPLRPGSEEGWRVTFMLHEDRDLAGRLRTRLISPAPAAP